MLLSHSLNSHGQCKQIMLITPEGVSGLVCIFKMIALHANFNTGGISAP